jgi:hypothetical protein
VSLIIDHGKRRGLHRNTKCADGLDVAGEAGEIIVWPLVVFCSDAVGTSGRAHPDLLEVMSPPMPSQRSPSALLRSHGIASAGAAGSALTLGRRHLRHHHLLPAHREPTMLGPHPDLLEVTEIRREGVGVRE